MIGAISGYSSLTYYNPYLNRAGGAEQAGRVASLGTARRAAPETPVEPVRPVTAVGPQEAKPLNTGLPVLREGTDPVEMAVRMRIQYGEPAEEAAQTARLPGQQQAEDAQTLRLPGQRDGEESPDAADKADAAVGAEAVQEAAEEGKCETCAKRKYQDESDDPGVSFQTPTNVGPEQAASAVRGHEMEHVVREQAKARREDRKVVSQSVSYHTAICPECGKAYVSGGTTRTVTAANNQPDAAYDQARQEREKTPAGFSAVA